MCKVLAQLKQSNLMFEIILNLTEKFCEHLKIDPDNESLTISASKRFIYIRTVSHGNSIRRTWRFESRYNPQGEFLGIYEYLPHLDTSEERREKIKDVIRNGPDLIQVQMAEFFDVSQALISKIIRGQ